MAWIIETLIYYGEAVFIFYAVVVLLVVVGLAYTRGAYDERRKDIKHRDKARQDGVTTHHPDGQDDGFD